MTRLLVLFLIVAGCQVETGGTSGDAPLDTTSARVVTPPLRDRADTFTVVTGADSAALRPSGPTVAAQQGAAEGALLDVVSRAPDADAQTLARVVGAADAQVGALQPRSPSLDSLRRVVRSAAQRGDRAGVAVAAARAYRVLTASRPDADPARLRADALVVSALARSPLPDWRALRASASALAQRWEASRARVTDAGVQDAMSQAVSGIESGAESQNADVVRLGAGVAADLAGSL